MASILNYKNSQNTSQGLHLKLQKHYQHHIRLLPTYEKYNHSQRSNFHQYTTLPNKVGLIKIDKYNIKHCNLSTTPSKDVTSEAYI